MKMKNNYVLLTIIVVVLVKFTNQEHGRPHTRRLSETVEDKCGHVIKPIPFLDISKIMGQWYLSEEYPHFTNETCQKIVIRPFRHNAFTLISTEYDNKSASIARDIVRAIMAYPPKGYLSIRRIIGEDDYYVPNIIFGTDYSSYLMFYRCHKKIEEVWILTRQQNMTHNLKTKINKFKHKINFPLEAVPQRTVCDWPL